MTIRLRKELEDRNKYNTISGVGGDIDEDPTGDAQIAEEIALQDRIDAGIEAADEEPGTGDGPQVVDAGTADIQDFADIYEPPAQVAAPTYTQPSPHRHEGPDPPDAGGGRTPGGHHWAKGGRVGYGKGGIVDLLK